MTPLPWPIEKIVDVAVALQTTGQCGASTREQIAAAFVLNRMEFLPESDSDVIDAWECLGEWQQYVKQIKRDCMHLIQIA
jgi:hypothetical protein